MKRQASLNYLNKQIWNLKSGSENGTLHRRIVVSSDQPIMDWAKTSLMLRDEKSLYALGVESGVAPWTWRRRKNGGVNRRRRKRRRQQRRRKWRRQSGAERGVVNSGVESGVVEVAPKVASSTVASSKGVVNRRRRKASSTVASSTVATSNGIE